MSFCPACGLTIAGDGICLHHLTGSDNWAVGNRVMCDLLHRKKIPPRLSDVDRLDEFFWGV